MALGEVPLGWKSLHPPSRVGCPPCRPRKHGGSRGAAPVPPRLGALPDSPCPSERCRVLVDAGAELFAVPSPGHQGAHGGGSPALQPFGTEEVPAGGTPPAPCRCGPAGGSPPPGQLAPAEAPGLRRGEAPEPPGARLAARLELRAAATGSHPLQAAGPRLIRSEPVDSVLRALAVELGLARADELPELWLGHYELDSPSNLPAGYGGWSAAGAGGSYFTPPVPAAPGTGAAGAGNARSPAECGKGWEEKLGPRCLPQNPQASRWARQTRVSSCRVIKSGRIVVRRLCPLSISAKDIVWSSPRWKEGGHPSAPVLLLGL